MKTITSLLGRLVFLGVLLAACAYSAQADGKTAVQEKTWTGTITAVDANNRTVQAENYLRHRTFVLGDNCALALVDKSKAAFGDLRPGQKVEISYQNADGVLVADHIAQQMLVRHGEIVALDPARHELTLRDQGRRATFTLADEGIISLKGDRKGTFDDLKLGERVTITYEIPHDQLMAREIDQKSRIFVGTLAAINLENRTLTAKQGSSDQKFNLASDCSVVMNGRLDNDLHALNTGGRYELDYDNVNGVNVVTRIAPATMPNTPEVSTSENTPIPAMPSY